MRKKEENKNIIEIKEEVQIGDVVLEEGDKIKVITPPIKETKEIRDLLYLIKQLQNVPKTDEEEIWSLFDDIQTKLPEAFEKIASKLGIPQDETLRDFIEEMVDPDINSPEDWRKLLKNSKLFLKAYEDFADMY